MGLSKMVFRPRNTIPDRESLLSTQMTHRSEFLQKERREPKLLKQLSRVFRRGNDRHHTLKPEGDDPTPPSSPLGSDEPLTVSMITSPYPHTLEEDFSHSGRTTSDLSASVKRSMKKTTDDMYSDPVMDKTEEGHETETFKSVPTINTHPPTRGCDQNCEPDSVLSRMFGVVDQGCGVVLGDNTFQCNSGSTSGTRSSVGPFQCKTGSTAGTSVGPSWGTAPSGDEDDDDTVSRLYPASSSTITPSRFSPFTLPDGRSPLQTEARSTESLSSKQLSKDTNQDLAPESPPPANETFELVLSPSILKKDAAKRPILKWRRNNHAMATKCETAVVAQSVDPINHEEKSSTPIKHVESKGIPESLPRASRKPPVVPMTKSFLPTIVEKIRMRNKSEGAKELADALMEDGELLGEEFLEENEENTLQSTTAPISLTKSSSELDEALSETENKSRFELTPDLKPLDLSNRTTSWTDLTKALANLEAWNSQAAGVRSINRSSSSPNRLLLDSPKPQKAATKSLWKSAVDPITGRPYYYHRITRKSTWTKPPNFDPYAQQEQEPRLCTSVRPVTAKASDFLARSRSSIPLDITATSILPDFEKNVKEESDIPVGENGQPILTRTSQRDFQTDVWEKKKEITRLLTKMAPPSDESILKVLAQYEEREDELLVQLVELVASQPFDEPGELPADDAVNVSLDSSRVAASSFALRTRTANTTTTSKTEKTDRIKNTSKPQNVCQSIQESTNDVSVDLNDDSISTESDLKEALAGPRQSQRTLRALEAKQRATGRTRHLRVEEFSSKRWSLAAVNYEGKASPKQPSQKPQKPRVNPLVDISTSKPESFASPSALIRGESSENESNYMGDNDETDVETYTDTVSALSVPDPDFSYRMEEFERTRRKALDDAIQRKDWDLAAAVTDNIRNRSMDSIDIGGAHSEWTQSELDQFISENDWDAVASYIAQMRDGKSKAAAAVAPSNTNITKSSLPSDVHSEAGKLAQKTVSFDANVQKRFGARSQLQRVMTEDEQSNSSWESESFYESDSESSSSISDEFGRTPVRKEFAC